MDLSYGKILNNKIKQLFPPLYVLDDGSCGDFSYKSNLMVCTSYQQISNKEQIRINHSIHFSISSSIELRKATWKGEKGKEMEKIDAFSKASI